MSAVNESYRYFQQLYNFLSFLRVPPFKWEIYVSDTIGISLSESRLFLTFFFMIILAMPVQALKGQKAREGFVLFAGIGLSIYVYAQQTLLIFPPIIATYCIAKFIPHYAGVTSFLMNFGYLLSSYSLLDSYVNWRKGLIDVTAPIMVLVFKAIAFSWSCQDRVNKKDQMVDYIKEKSEFEFPSLFEFLSYMFNGGNILVGPFNEFKDFQDMMKKKGVWSDDAKPYKMPSQIPAAIRKLLQSFLIIALYALLGSYLTNSQMLVFGDYFERGLISRIYAVTLASFTLRMRYYVVWSLSEVSIILQGLGYEGWIYRKEAGLHTPTTTIPTSSAATTIASATKEIVQEVNQTFKDVVQEPLTSVSSVDYVPQTQVNVGSDLSSHVNTDGGVSSGSDADKLGSHIDKPTPPVRNIINERTGQDNFPHDSQSIDPHNKDSDSKNFQSHGQPSTSQSQIPHVQNPQSQDSYTQNVLKKAEREHGHAQSQEPSYEDQPGEILLMNKQIDLSKVKDRKLLQPSFNRYINSDFVAVEFCENSALIARHWNKCSGSFLRYYVYERVKSQKGSSSFVATYTTMMVSALWHGLSPGYFIFFGGYSLQVELGRYIYRLEKDGIFSKYKGSLLYRLIKSQITIFGLNALVPVFTLLEWQSCVRYMNSVYYLPIIIPGLLVLLCKAGLTKLLMHKKKSKAKAE